LLIKLVEPLETKRLFIQQFTQEDIDYLVPNLNSDVLKPGLQINYNDKKDDKVYLTLLLRISDQIIGFIMLQPLEEKEQLECYYELLPQYTGNGYAIEAMKKVFAYVFTNHKLTKIVAYVEQGNSKGWKVAERSGLKYMGDVVRKDADAKVLYFVIDKKDYVNQFQN